MDNLAAATFVMGKISFICSLEISCFSYNSLATLYNFSVKSVLSAPNQALVGSILGKPFKSVILVVSILKIFPAFVTQTNLLSFLL